MVYFLKKFWSDFDNNIIVSSLYELVWKFSFFFFFFFLVYNVVNSCYTAKWFDFKTYMLSVLNIPFHYGLSEYIYIYFFYFLNFKIFNSYMRSQTRTPLPPPSPQHLSGSSPCTSPKQAAPYVRHGLAIQFLHDSRSTVYNSQDMETT